MGDFITSSEVSLAHLKDQCWLLKNVLRDVLKLGVAERVDQVLACFRPLAQTSGLAQALSHSGCHAKMFYASGNNCMGAFPASILLASSRVCSALNACKR